MAVLTWFRKAPLQEWFDEYQYEIDYNIDESTVKYPTLEDLDIHLRNFPLRYRYHRGKPELRELIAKQYESLSPDQVLLISLYCSLTSLVFSRFIRALKLLPKAPDPSRFSYRSRN